MTSSITKALHSKYSQNCKYKVENAYVFKENWESDFFVLKDNGYSYEFEIKISRSDFFADKKKVEKHCILKNGFYETWQGNYDYATKQYVRTTKQLSWSLRPNKFFYVVPAGLIKKEEIPPYAGLMYFSESDSIPLTTIKEAPFIHKEICDLNRRLCSKFYYNWVGAKRKIWDLEMTIKHLKSGQQSLFS